MSRSESTATTKPSTVSPEPRAKHKNKTAQCYRFDADIGSVRDWPSRAVAWLAMMEEHVRARDDIFSDRLKYDFYVSRLGYGPSTRLSWARKSGRVKDLRTFLDWFKERYIDFVDKNRLCLRYQNVRQTSTVLQYILDFDRVHRANRQLVPLDRVVGIFCQNLRDRSLASWIEAHRDPGMDLEDIMTMAIMCMDERQIDRFGLNMAYTPLTPDAVCCTKQSE